LKKGLFVFIVVLVALVIGWKIPQLPPLKPLIIIAAIMVFLITLVRTNFGLVILVFSMLLSPEIQVATLQHVVYRAVVLRIDDLLLFVVFIAWIVKIAVRKEWGILRQTPLNLPIALYLLVCLLATFRGIISNEVSPTTSFFYFLKYIEYFMIYFMFTNNIHSRKQVRMFMIPFLITAACVSIYAISEIPTGRRVSAPFEGVEGECNTLAGYLILVISACLGSFLYSKSSVRRWLWGGMICLAIVPFVYTLSRGGYVGLICAYIALIVLTRKKKALLIWIFCLIMAFFPMIVPRRVIERVNSTFEPAKEVEIFGTTLRLETSAAQRIEVWTWIFEKWKAKPLIGYGVTGVGFVDNQYARVLGEVGALGFLIFIWLLVSIYRNLFQIFKTTQGDYYKGLAMGVLAGFAGICAQAFTGNTFIIVRVMEPFWFLIACVMVLPHLPAQETELENLSPQH